MEKDALQEFRDLRRSLLDEKAKIEDRLNQLTEALKNDKIQSPTKYARRLPEFRDTNKRFRNNVTLREAVRQITFHQPLTREEILTEIQRIDHPLSTRDLAGPLNSILHRDRQIKKKHGRYSSQLRAHGGSS